MTTLHHELEKKVASDLHDLQTAQELLDFLVRRLKSELKENRDLRAQMQVDPKTGLLYLKYFKQRLKRYFTSPPSLREKATEMEGGRKTFAAILMLDIDDFRKYNKLHGVHVGDKVLGLFGFLLRWSFRWKSREDEHARDLQARYGGDEFCVFTHDIPDQVKLGEIVQRFKDRLEGTEFAPPERGPKLFRLSGNLKITTSIGVIYWEETGTAYPSCVAQKLKDEGPILADEQLRIAKEDIARKGKFVKYAQVAIRNGHFVYV